MTTLGEVYRMYRMCRRCTEGVQKGYRRCTKVYRRLLVNTRDCSIPAALNFFGAILSLEKAAPALVQLEHLSNLVSPLKVGEFLHLHQLPQKHQAPTHLL